MNGQKAQLTLSNRERRSFQGVLNILSFNRHYYFFGLGLIALQLASQSVFHYPVIYLKILLISTLVGLMLPLFVSAWVYDFANYYEMNWLERLLDEKDVKNMLNIHAGFDETSFLVQEKFPETNLQVFDFYGHHTEIAIERAKKVSHNFPNTQVIDTDKLPVANRSQDVILFLSALHEVRKEDDRIEFLKECQRSLKDGGQIIIVEHLRDLPNFLAFTVGFTHFFSKRSWLRCFTAAGFTEINEQKHTPFMSIFELKK